MTTPDILDPPVIDQSPVAPSPAHQDTTGPSAPDASASPAAQAFVPRRRRGPRPKIALLPPEQIALVNQLLDQDKTYEEIVAEMATHGVTLNIDNVSKWYNGPYQEYLDSLDWQEELQRVRSHALAFGPDLVNAPFQEGLLQIGLTQLFRDLKQDRYKDHPVNAVRLFNALARLSREALVHRKYSDQCAKEKKEERKPLDPEREFNEKEHTLCLNAADRLFGFKPNKPIGPPLSEVYAK